MVTLTPAAATQIQTAATESGAAQEELILRLAARPQAGGGLGYGMGFDELKDEDISYKSEGVMIAIAPEFGQFLQGATLDYVELTPGKFEFIFLNPNDENYSAPSEAEAGGCSGGSCSGCGN